VFVCWQELARNPWMRVPLQAAAPHLPPQTPPAPGAPGPFAFADPVRLRGILEAAGFRDVAIDPFETPLEIGGPGGTLEQAVELVMGLGPMALALREAGPELRLRVMASVREAIAPYATPAGVKIGCAAWIVRAV
jgi:hypothetical protein